ncbi:phage holin family protein [Sphingomonas baiyangensis]|uniref:Phage holin family protein n=1 Tax=Sphingomonas baiyangensis TaxID=2572576 RepID=A0A4U1KZT7_9SPHN|nr:phage holin family protein [Sphingomonas baiyangensis]TKD49949.1 phage holin family protein [Sphingomonas baiyangensis]
MTVSGGIDTEEPGVAALLGRTVEDGKRWARAEIGFYKALASDRAGDAGIGIGLAIGAMVLAQAALIALLVGLVLALTPAIGAGWATLLVVGVTLALVAVLALMARGRLRRVLRPASGGMA